MGKKCMTRISKLQSSFSKCIANQTRQLVLIKKLNIYCPSSLSQFTILHHHNASILQIPHQLSSLECKGQGKGPYKIDGYKKCRHQCNEVFILFNFNAYLLNVCLMW